MKAYGVYSYSKKDAVEAALPTTASKKNIYKYK